MAGVFIDIPGIGNVEAKNAATEATLKEILKAIKGGGLGGRGSGGGPGGGGSPGGGGGLGGGTPAGGGGGFFSKAAGAAGKTMFGLGKAAGGVVGGLGKLATGAGFVVGKMAKLAESGVDTAEKLSKIDGSAASAAEVLSMIPGVGGLLAKVFGAVAGAADKMVKAYGEATASGATFGGSIGQFSAAASAAGMNLAEFGALISKNGEAMGAFGVTTEDGSKRFAQVSKTLRTTSSDLYALGYNTQEINQGLANYGKLLRAQGAQGTKSNAELAAGAKSYLKEMDMLAKVTGEERAAKEKEREALAADGQFRAAMAGLGPEVEASAMTLIQSMPSKEMQDFAKDLIANGTATTDANRALLAQMPQLGAQFANLHAQTQRGVKVSQEQMNQSLNIGRAEATSSLKNIKYAAAASEEMRGTAAALGSWNKVNKDAIKTAGEQQESTKKNTDGFNEKMQKMSQVLNSISNTFTELLASSGFLDLMISGVELVAQIFTGVLAPALKALDAGFRPIIDILTRVLPPVFAVVGALFEKIGFGLKIIFEPIIQKISKTLEGVSLQFESFKGAIDLVDEGLNWLFGILSSVVKATETAFGGLWEAVTGLMQPLDNLWKAVTDIFTSGNELVGSLDWLERTILEVGQVVGDAFKILGAVLGWVIDTATDVYKWFNEVVMKSETVSKYFKTLGEVISDVWQTFRKYFSVEGIKAIFANLNDGFEAMIDKILNLIPNRFGGMSDEVYEQRKKDREARAKARDEALVAAKEEKDAKIQTQLAEVKAEKKKFAEKQLFTEANNKLSKKELAGREAAAKAAEQASVDYTAGPEELLKQYATREGSALVPKADAAKTASPTTREQQASAKADAAKTAIEADKESQRAAAAKKAEEEAAAKAKQEEEKKRAEERGPTQESAETLLAELNTKMGQLLKLSAQTTTNTYEQINATKSLSGNLYRA